MLTSGYPAGLTDAYTNIGRVEVRFGVPNTSDTLVINSPLCFVGPLIKDVSRTLAKGLVYVGGNRQYGILFRWYLRLDLRLSHIQ